MFVYVCVCVVVAAGCTGQSATLACVLNGVCVCEGAGLLCNLLQCVRSGVERREGHVCESGWAHNCVCVCVS